MRQRRGWRVLRPGAELSGWRGRRLLFFCLFVVVVFSFLLARGAARRLRARRVVVRGGGFRGRRGLWCGAGLLDGENRRPLFSVGARLLPLRIGVMWWMEDGGCGVRGRAGHLDFCAEGGAAACGRAGDGGCCGLERN